MTRLLFLVWMLILPGVSFAACTSISASTVDFGIYTGAAVMPTTGIVTIQCTNAFAYRIGLSAGGGGGVTTRQMKNGASTLNYAMYQDATYTTNWGNTSGTDARAGTTTVASGSSTNLTVYAKLTALQYPIPGAYTDTITATEFASGSITASFTVKATVQATCTISASTLNFLVYTGSAVSANSTITATCTNTTPYNVGLSVGNGPSATVTTRQMTGPSGAYQPYSLFRDAGRSQNWGNTIGTDTVAQTGSGSAQAITVYGQVAAGQRLTAPGSYTDTIVATLTY